MSDWLRVTVSLLFVLMVAPLAIKAQQDKNTYRIGYLCTFGSQSQGYYPFLFALEELGYEVNPTPSRDAADKQNISLEGSSCGLSGDYLRAKAAEAVRSRLNVIVAPGLSAAQAVREADKTASTQVIFVGVDDPVSAGFVESLAQPGGNFTGMATLSPELSAKRLQLLKDTIPGLDRVALLYNRNSIEAAPAVLTETEKAARALGIELQLVETSAPEGTLGLVHYPGFESAFTSALKSQVDALMVMPDPAFFEYRHTIIKLAERTGLPVMYWEREYVERGGLIAYGPSLADQHQRAAVYVDKLLKGAHPATLPVEQPMRFELTINLETAHKLGIEFPASILIQADRVIKPK